ncbi:MAG: hypothetical protein MUF03_01075 [Rubrivivax sp.]|jgi:hypothetical protein|nr:hypothetical protein [Rubrivivax sp.]
MSDFASQLVAAGAFTLIAAAIAGATYVLTRWNNYKTLSAKYRDRLYELNKLGVQYGDVAYEYLNPANFTGSYFTRLSGVPAGATAAALAGLQLAARVRSYVFFRLNFYEELFYATESRHVVVEDRAIWRAYLETQLRHPLVRELLTLERQRFGVRFVAFAGL